MKEITKECLFRPRVYCGSLNVNIFYHDIYLGSIRKGGEIDRESGAEGFTIVKKHGLFEVFEK